MSKANSLRFFATGTLSILINPFLFVQALLLNIGQLYVRLRDTNELTRSGGPVTSQRYGLPLCGEWLVSNGGVTRRTSHSWDMPNQRYAYDFVKEADSLEGKSRWERRNLADFPALGQPVFAPADGIVVRARDGQRDYRFPGSGIVDMWCRDIRGNHILIQHRQDEFSLLAHLRKGSVAVAAGDYVGVGQKIGGMRKFRSFHRTPPALPCSGQAFLPCRGRQDCPMDQALPERHRNRRLRGPYPQRLRCGRIGADQVVCQHVTLRDQCCHPHLDPLPRDWPAGGKVGDAGGGPLPRGPRRQRRTRRRGAFPLRSALTRTAPVAQAPRRRISIVRSGTVRRTQVVLERVLDIVVVEPVAHPIARCPNGTDASPHGWWIAWRETGEHTSEPVP